MLGGQGLVLAANEYDSHMPVSSTIRFDISCLIEHELSLVSL